MRILGLDYGSKTVGVAVSDPLGLTAQKVETIWRKQENKLRRTLARIEELAAEYGVEKIVVGLPKNMNNSLGFKAEEIQNFIEGFKSYLPDAFPIDWIDERLTTVQAENVLLEANVSRKKRKKFVDKIAAVFMLQTYMDMH